MSCSGEMHRYDIEHLLRRQQATHILTLRHESVGIKQGGLLNAFAQTHTVYRVCRVIIV